MPADEGALATLAPVPGVAKPDPILTVDNVFRSFGGLAAVDVDHLEIERGRITALIGPNGAGKTTLFNLLTGFDRPQRGDWSFDGRKLHGVSAYRVARAGMVRTFQLTKALARMTVLENMKLAAPRQSGERAYIGLFYTWRNQERAVEQRAVELLERFNLAQMRDQYAATLSGGQRKLLEMARALMTDPTLVMLDEPMAGVNPALVQSLLDHIRALRAEGLTVLFVEHDMDVVMGISDWVVCMAEGAVIAEGPPQSIVTNDEVIDAYLGTHRAARHRVGES
jgi:neutral amino acid transport system ATP-binding protein